MVLNLRRREITLVFTTPPWSYPGILSKEKVQKAYEYIINNYAYDSEFFLHQPLSICVDSSIAVSEANIVSMLERVHNWHISNYDYMMGFNVLGQHQSHLALLQYDELIQGHLTVKEIDFYCLLYGRVHMVRWENYLLDKIDRLWVEKSFTSLTPAIYHAIQ